jgi:hypothetical protein
VYLNPAAALAVAQRLARDQNDSLTVTLRTLQTRLKEKHVLKSTDQTRGTATIRKTIGNRVIEVLHLSSLEFKEADGFFFAKGD